MVTRLVRWLCVLATVAATQGCYDAKEYPIMTTIPLELSADGAIQSSDLGISGHWYAYGDAYDVPARCTGLGEHCPNECAQVGDPELPILNAAPSCGPPPVVDLPSEADGAHFRNFAPSGNGMCTTGRVERVLCLDPTGECGQSGNYDYSNMWGAGIGFDFEPSSDQTRGTWNPEPYGVIGVAFDLQVLGEEDGPDDLPLTSLRVEFPIKFAEDVTVPNMAVRLDGTVINAGHVLHDGTSEEFPGGSPLWRTKQDKVWNSLVTRGYNEVLFSDLSLPATDTPPNYPLDFTRLVGVQFHAAPDIYGARNYHFCISNLALIHK